MLLAIDIGHTHTVLGIFQNKKLIAHWRVSSPVLRTEDEIFLLVKTLCEHNKIDTNKIEITVTPHEGVNEKPFQCENRMGYFEAIALIFNYNCQR